MKMCLFDASSRRRISYRDFTQAKIPDFPAVDRTPEENDLGLAAFGLIEIAKVTSTGWGKFRTTKETDVAIPRQSGRPVRCAHDRVSAFTTHAGTKSPKPCGIGPDLCGQRRTSKSWLTTPVSTALALGFAIETGRLAIRPGIGDMGSLLRWMKRRPRVAIRICRAALQADFQSEFPTDQSANSRSKCAPPSSQSLAANPWRAIPDDVGGRE